MDLFGPPNIEKLKAKGDIGGLLRALIYKKNSFDTDHVRIRKAAALALGSMSNAQAVEPLLEALNDCGPVREAAIESLGSLGDGRAIKPLLARVQSSEVYVQKAAENALVKLGERAVPELVTMLAEKGSKSLRSIVFILGRIGDPRAVSPIISLLVDGNGIWEPAVEALVKIGYSSIEPLKDALNDENRYVRNCAAETLDRLGWKSETDEDQARYWVAKLEWEKCASLGGAAVDALIFVITDPDKEIALKATEALEKIGAEAVDPLLDLLQNGAADKRAAVVEILSRIGDFRAVESMLGALKGDMLDVRMAVIIALGRIGDARAVDPLLTTLNDPIVGLRIASVTALGLIGDIRAVEALISLLGDQNEALRSSAVEALGAIGDGNAVYPLLELLQETDEKMRNMAARALGQIGDIRAVDGLISLLCDPNEEFQISAVEALGKIGDGKAVEPLLEILQSENEILRSGTVRALGEIGDFRAVEPLIAFLKNPHSDVRRATGNALANCGWEPDEENLGWYLAARQEWDQCAALGKLALEPLILALKDNQEEVRKGAVKTLRSFKDDYTVERIGVELKILRGDALWSGLDALIQIGTPHATEAIISLTNVNPILFAFCVPCISPDLRILPLIAGFKDLHILNRRTVIQILRGDVEKAGSVEALIYDKLGDRDKEVQTSAIAEVNAILGSAF